MCTHRAHYTHTYVSDSCTAHHIALHSTAQQRNGMGGFKYIWNNQEIRHNFCCCYFVYTSSFTFIVHVVGIDSGKTYTPTYVCVRVLNAYITNSLVYVWHSRRVEWNGYVLVFCCYCRCLNIFHISQVNKQRDTEFLCQKRQQ